MTHHILCINPGSTSTKIAYFDDHTELYNATAHHAPEELARYPHVVDQAGFRTRVILGMLSNSGVTTENLSCVVGRGGLSKPIPSGTYAVDETLIDDLTHSPLGEHASNLGAVLAQRIADFCRVPAFIVDPVVVDELDAVARYSGHPEIQRRSIFHALNQKAVAKRHAKAVGTPYEALSLIVVHLGGGVSVGAHRRGRIVDVNNGLNGDGPFAPERSGTLPISDFAELCFSGRYTGPEVQKLLAGKGGFVSLLGTNDGREVSRRIAAGDEQAALVQDALAYQVAKDVGAAAAVLRGHVDGVLLTGGLAHNADLVEAIRRRIAYVGDVHVYPGEDEMVALCEGGLRVLTGEEEAKSYAAR